MPVFTRLFTLFCLIAGPALSQSPGVAHLGDFTLPTHDEMPAEERAVLIERLDFVADSLSTLGILSTSRGNSGGSGFTHFPVRGAENNPYFNTWGISNYVDHNPAVPNQLLDYACGARTYDLTNGYNHAGVDIFSWPFGWDAMDNNLVEIVAVTSGVILAKHDGNFDRNCTMGGGQWNAVYVAHDDGTIGWYGHMKQNSLTSKNVGDSVAAGEFLGIVGSSGSSTGPHLHLEVYAPGNQLVDPYAGPCNSMNEESYWAVQPAYYQTALNAILTHTELPVFHACPATHETLNVSTNFQRGNTFYMALYYRDQLGGHTTNLRITRPSGSIWYDWTHTPTGFEHYAASYWYWMFDLPADAEEGQYTIDINYQGQAYSQTFWVGTTSNEDISTASELALDVFPNPATHTTRINVATQAGEATHVAIYDLMGRDVQVLHDAPAGSDQLSLTVDAGRLAVGVYIVRAQVGAEQAVQRLTILR